MFQAPSPPPQQTKKVTVKKEQPEKIAAPEKLAPSQPTQPPNIKSGKKSKKKFARHKIRSESPENLITDLDLEPTETGVIKYRIPLLYVDIFVAIT